MESLTLSPQPRLREDTLLPDNTIILREAEEVAEFYRQHPELAGLFDDAFKTELAEYWDKTAYIDSVPTSPEVREQELIDALEREKSFFAKVYSTAVAMAEADHDKITLMFDVDDTIRQAGTDIARPAFALVIDSLGERLGAGSIEIGLLTTIKREQLSRNAGYLLDVQKYLNEQFFISSPIEEKNAVMNSLGRLYPERGFVYFDDLRAAEEVQGSNVRGVWLGPEVHDQMMRAVYTAA